MVLSIVALSGCAEGKEELPDPELILTGFPPTDPDEDRLRSWAEDILTGECVVDGGYSYEVLWEDQSEFSYGSRSYLRSLYLIPNQETVESVGYDNVTANQGGPAERPQSKIDDYMEELSGSQKRDRQSVISGNGELDVEIVNPDGSTGGHRTGGCEVKAMEKLYGDPEKWLMAEGSLRSIDVNNAMHMRVGERSEYHDLLEEWSVCMEQRGYPQVATPQGAYSKSEDMSDNESRAMAISHAECNSVTSFESKIVDLHSTELDRFRQENENLYDLLNELKEKGNGQAQKVLERYNKSN
ncbi:hypothetical protein [Haloglycomyces albus]|uniref:hypothetical protein n=1 Tax=Haloglycomyces albus TaxID=526067 RepID=UPI0012EBD3C1|nr:hypothetical protein [Haloglycomyces albus]